jgi:SAM-dependent methyltransferase
MAMRNWFGSRTATASPSAGSATEHDILSVLKPRPGMPEYYANTYFPPFAKYVYHPMLLHLHRWTGGSFAGLRVLDVGSGYCDLALMLHRLGAHVSTLDFFLQERVESLEQFTCNIEEERFPFEDDRFDVVVLSDVIEHLNYDYLHPLVEMRRVCRSDGLLLLSTPNAAGVNNFEALIKGKNIYPELYGYYIKPTTSVGPTGRVYIDRHNRLFTHQEVHYLLFSAGWGLRRWIFTDLQELPMSRVLPFVSCNPEASASDLPYTATNHLLGVFSALPTVCVRQSEGAQLVTRNDCHSLTLKRDPAPGDFCELSMDTAAKQPIRLDMMLGGVCTDSGQTGRIVHRVLVDGTVFWERDAARYPGWVPMSIPLEGVREVAVRVEAARAEAGWSWGEIGRLDVSFVET